MILNLPQYKYLPKLQFISYYCFLRMAIDVTQSNEVVTVSATTF